MKKIYFLLFCSFLFAGCSDRQEGSVRPEEKKPPREIELSAVGFEELEGWQADNLEEFIPVFDTNCKRIQKITTPYLGNSKIKVNTEDYKRACAEFSACKIGDEKAFRHFLEQNFTPYLVQADGNAEGKFTSYYESEIHASRHRHGRYIYPVYGKPDDLVEINLKDFDPSLPDKRLTGRIEGQKMRPYYTRAEIENTELKAPVLLWGDSAVDIHVMQIQGSAVAKLDDGSSERIGYADNNGRPFTGIGSILLGKGLVKPGQADMISIKKWLKENPDRAKELMQENERYIFHRIIDGSGPVGAFGVPLSAGRSLAVDKSYVPLGALLWLSTHTPDKKPLNKMVAAQDIGSAIKGAVRGDYFWGSGGDEILASAGKMNSAGHYYILVPKGSSDD